MREEYEEIKRLSYAYVRSNDAGDFSAVADLLADAELRMVSPGVSDKVVKGRDAIERFYRDQVILYDGSPRTKHLVTNHVITIEPDRSRADAHSYFTVLQKCPGEPLEIVVTGQYHDSFERRADGWHFASKQIQSDYFNRNIERHFRVAESHRHQGESQ